MHPSDVPSFPSHRAHPPHTHGEAEQEARGSLWGSLITRAIPPPAGKRGSACPGGTQVILSLPSWERLCWEGATLQGSLNESSLGGAFLLDQPGDGAGLPLCCSIMGSSSRLEQQHSSGSPPASRARAGRREASDLLPCSLFCLLLATVPHAQHLPGQGARAGSQLCSHGPAGPILGVPWTQELQQDGTACPGTGQWTLTWERSVPGYCPSTCCSSVLLSPSCPQRMAL